MAKRYGYPGLKASSYPRSVRYKVDYDYLHKLTDEEKKFLEKVTNDEVGGSAPSGYGAKNAANRDMLTHYDSDAYFQAYYEDLADSCAETDGTETPEYLDSDEYKSALRGFRTHVHDNYHRRPEMTMAMMRAKKRLEKSKK